MLQHPFISVQAGEAVCEGGSIYEQPCSKRSWRARCSAAFLLASVMAVALWQCTRKVEQQPQIVVTNVQIRDDLYGVDPFFSGGGKQPTPMKWPTSDVTEWETEFSCSPVIHGVKRDAICHGRGTWIQAPISRGSVLYVLGKEGCLQRKTGRRSAVPSTTPVEYLPGEAYRHTEGTVEDCQQFRVEEDGSTVKLKAMDHLARKTGRNGEGGVGYLGYDPSSPYKFKDYQAECMSNRCAFRRFHLSSGQEAFMPIGGNVTLTAHSSKLEAKAAPPNYDYFPRSCIKGHNIGYSHHKTVTECATLCDAEDRCKAFEYGVAYGGHSGASPGDCTLNDFDDASGCDGSYYNYDLYTKKVPNYDYKPRACVSGHNIRFLHGKTVTECAARCDEEDKCRAFEYGMSYGGPRNRPGDCMLNDFDDPSGCDGPGNNFDLYTKKICVWQKEQNTYSGGYAGGVRTSFRKLEEAKRKCIELGSARCKAITCSAGGVCSLRGSEKLYTSHSGETTYVPSGESCFVTKVPYEFIAHHSECLNDANQHPFYVQLRQSDNSPKNCYSQCMSWGQKHGKTCTGFGTSGGCFGYYDSVVTKGKKSDSEGDCYAVKQVDVQGFCSRCDYPFYGRYCEKWRTKPRDPIDVLVIVFASHRKDIPSPLVEKLNEYRHDLSKYEGLTSDILIYNLPNIPSLRPTRELRHFIKSEYVFRKVKSVFLVGDFPIPWINFNELGDRKNHTTPMVQYYSCFSNKQEFTMYMLDCSKPGKYYLQPAKVRNWDIALGVANHMSAAELVSYFAKLHNHRAGGSVSPSPHHWAFSSGDWSCDPYKPLGYTNSSGDEYCWRGQYMVKSKKPLPFACNKAVGCPVWDNGYKHCAGIPGKTSSGPQPYLRANKEANLTTPRKGGSGSAPCRRANKQAYMAMVNRQESKFEYYSGRVHASYTYLGFGASTKDLRGKPFSGIKFFKLFHCSSGRLTVQSLAHTMAFTSKAGLAAVAPQAVGAMLYDQTYFEKALKAGYSWGQAFKIWRHHVDPSASKTIESWTVHIVPFGDPEIRMRGGMFRSQTGEVSQNYNHLLRACVTGHNIGTFHHETVEGCATLCDAEDRCKAFEYGVAYGGKSGTPPGVCSLNDSDNPKGCDGSYYNYDLYTKKVPGLNYQLDEAKHLEETYMQESRDLQDEMQESWELQDESDNYELYLKLQAEQFR